MGEIWRLKQKGNNIILFLLVINVKQVMLGLLSRSFFFFPTLTASVVYL